MYQINVSQLMVLSRIIAAADAGVWAIFCNFFLG